MGAHGISSIKKMLLGNGRGEGIDLASVRPSMLRYVLAYTFELVFYAVWGSFLPVETGLLGLPGKTAAYIGHMAGSLIVMLLWSERFTWLIRISAAVTLGGFIPFVFADPGGSARLILSIAAMTGLGGAVTCARCGYAFAANNAERLVGISVMTLSVAGVYALELIRLPEVLTGRILPLALLFAMCYCLLRFKEGDLAAKQESGREDARGLYWALAFMIVYFGIDGYIYKLTGGPDGTPYGMFCLGIALAGIAFFLSQVRLRLNVWHLWSVFFALALLMAVTAVLAPAIGSELPFHFLGGLAILGWPLCLYMLACAQRRFASYRLLKRCTVIFVVLSPLTTVSDDLFRTYMPERMPLISLIYVVTMLVLFLVTLPESYRSLFSAVWISDLHMNDMKELREKVEETDRFGGCGLTARQKEVAALLLAGKTRRQISGELGLSESTVKTHTSDLYRKLGINSRTELFAAFGVTVSPKSTSIIPDEKA